MKVPVGPADHSQGPATARLLWSKYGDYECSHCGHAYSIVKALQKKLGKQLRFFFETSRCAQYTKRRGRAETAEFAAARGKFWDMLT